MSKTIFRGKRLDNGEWVKGYLTRDKIEGSVKAFITTEDKETIEVDPETVGYRIRRQAKIRAFGDETAPLFIGDITACANSRGVVIGEHSFLSVESGRYAEDSTGERYIRPDSYDIELHTNTDIWDDVYQQNLPESVKQKFKFYHDLIMYNEEVK